MTNASLIAASLMANGVLSKKLNNDKCNAANPTHMGTVMGVRFFEHPSHGDEAPMFACIDGDWYLSTCYEIPSLDEMLY